jgi:6-phosphogluconate dehydrogenase (decarboxylating)
MQLAMIGLGRMGGNMVQRLLQGGHQVVVFDRSAEAVQAHVGMGAKGANSVVRSWLNEFAERAFAEDTELAALKGYVEDSGEGRWTVQEAPAPVITLSLLTRFRSRQSDSFGAKVIAALRNEFGGHAVKTT